MEDKHGLIINPELIDEKGEISINPYHKSDTTVGVGIIESPKMDQLLGALSREKNRNSLSNIALAVMPDEELSASTATYMMMTSNSSGADALPPYLFQPDVSDISHRRKLTPNENLWHPFIYTPFGKEQEELNFGRVDGLGYDLIPEGIEVGNLDDLLQFDSFHCKEGFQGFFNPRHSRVIFPLGGRGLDIDTANHTAYKISGVDKRQKFDLFRWISIFFKL